MTQPPIKPAEITLLEQRRFIEEIAVAYTDDRWTKRGLIADELAVVLRAVPGEPVLEVGAGGGVVLDYLRSTGREAWGVEVVPGMIDAAKAKGVTGLVNADAASLPFPNGCFALATLWGNTLGPIPGRENRVALLMEVHRTLRHDGWLAVSVLNRYAGPRRLLQPLEYVFRYPLAPDRRSTRAGYNRLYTPHQLKQELKQAGFSRFLRLSRPRDSMLVMLAGRSGCDLESIRRHTNDPSS